MYSDPMGRSFAVHQTYSLREAVGVGSILGTFIFLYKKKLGKKGFLLV
jgi:hypothetical protein